jgi:hypothetical protein
MASTTRPSMVNAYAKRSEGELSRSGPRSTVGSSALLSWEPNPTVSCRANGAAVVEI